MKTTGYIIKIAVAAKRVMMGQIKGFGAGLSGQLNT
jgi:hypothetical protein